MIEIKNLHKTFFSEIGTAKPVFKGLDLKIDDGDFVTIKNVTAGEELYYDYALAMTDPNYKLHCKCASEGCRGIITGNDWKDKLFVKQNYEYMHPHMKNMSKNHKL